MPRKISLITIVTGLLLVAGCSNDPTPDVGVAAGYKATKMAVTPLEQRLEIDGCTVTVSRVTTARSDVLADFTVAVAKCPTATVTSTSHNCGKSCNANNIVVQAAVPGASAPGAGEGEQELRAEVDRLSAKLARIQQASQP